MIRTEIEQETLYPSYSYSHVTAYVRMQLRQHACMSESEG